MRLIVIVVWLFSPHPQVKNYVASYILLLHDSSNIAASQLGWDNSTNSQFNLFTTCIHTFVSHLATFDTCTVILFQLMPTLSNQGHQLSTLIRYICLPVKGHLDSSYSQSYRLVTTLTLF